MSGSAAPAPAAPSAPNPPPPPPSGSTQRSPVAEADLTWALILVAAVSLGMIVFVYVGPVRAKLAALGYADANFLLRYGAGTLLGGLVGYSEVVLRYRDEPVRASLSPPGGVFILLNGAVAAFALFLVEYFSTPPERPGAVVQRVLLTGIGAMVVLRGKLLTVPTPGGGQAELGFAPLVEAILASVNRSIDRGRAFERMRIVPPLARQMAPLTFAKVAPFLRVGLQSLQTLDKDIQGAVLANIEALEKNTTYSDCAKLEAIGYDLLNNFGRRCFEEVFRQAAESAKL